jgi:hypothetical protein
MSLTDKSCSDLPNCIIVIDYRLSRLTFFIFFFLAFFFLLVFHVYTSIQSIHPHICCIHIIISFSMAFLMLLKLLVLLMRLLPLTRPVMPGTRPLIWSMGGWRQIIPSPLEKTVTTNSRIRLSKFGVL